VVVDSIECARWAGSPLSSWDERDSPPTVSIFRYIVGKSELIFI